MRWAWVLVTVVLVLAAYSLGSSHGLTDTGAPVAVSGPASTNSPQAVSLPKQSATARRAMEGSEESAVYDKASVSEEHLPSSTHTPVAKLSDEEQQAEEERLLQELYDTFEYQLATEEADNDWRVDTETVISEAAVSLGYKHITHSSTQCAATICKTHFSHPGRERPGSLFLNDIGFKKPFVFMERHLRYENGETIVYFIKPEQEPPQSVKDSYIEPEFVQR